VWNSAVVGRSSSLASRAGNPCSSVIVRALGPQGTRGQVLLQLHLPTIMVKHKKERRKPHAALTAQALLEHNTLHPPLFRGRNGLFWEYQRADTTGSGSSQQQVPMLHTPNRAIGAPSAHSGEDGNSGVERSRAAAPAPHSIAPETQQPLSWPSSGRRTSCTLQSLRQLQVAHPHAPPMSRLLAALAIDMRSAPSEVKLPAEGGGAHSWLSGSRTRGAPHSWRAGPRVKHSREQSEHADPNSGTGIEHRPPPRAWTSGQGSWAGR
jgi:hypothetical protein